MLKIPTASLHPNKVTSEPLGWGPSYSPESSSCSEINMQGGYGASDRLTGQPLGVLGERTKRTGSFCPSGLLRAGTLSTLSYLAPILQMMKQAQKGPRSHPGGRTRAQAQSTAPASLPAARSQRAWLVPSPSREGADGVGPVQEAKEARVSEQSPSQPGNWSHFTDDERESSEQ